MATNPRCGAWAAVERSSGVPAGTVLIKPLPGGEGEVEIGWHFHPDSWGKGLASESAAALWARGFAVGRKEVWAVTDQDNHASVAVCRRIGVRLLGVTHRWHHEPSLMFWAGALASSATSGLRYGRVMPTLIFVHGACVRDAAWWWSKMTRPLADRGIATAVVPLPSCGERGENLGDLYDDVDACRQAIAEADQPVVLCGHSYGGMIITEAGVDPRVTQLLYLTSVMPDAGQSQAELIGSEPAPWLEPGDDGTVGVDPDMIREYFLQDCDEVTIQQALSRLTRQSLTPFTQPPRQIAWQQRQATYFVCTADLATPAETQRRRVRAGTRVVEFDAGHHPFLSRPDAFAQTIAAEINSAGSPRI